MPNCQKAQALIDELLTPKVGPGKAEVAGAVATAATTVAGAAQRAAELGNMALQARLSAAADPLLIAKYESLQRRSQGIMRECEKAMEHLRRIASVFEQLDQESAELRGIAAGLGYEAAVSRAPGS
jgi:hypothetical protein